MRLLFLVAFGICSVCSVAQDYLLSDPRWHVRSTCAEPAPCIATHQQFYSLAGDTLIQNVLWTKVIDQGTISYNWQAAPPALGCAGTVNYGPSQNSTNLIRQQGRQLRILIGDQDMLLFDFDLVPGDTVPVSFTNWNTDITVVAVDSVLIGTTVRARYELGNSWAQYIVEGMGSSNGLFQPIANFLECGHELVCYGLGAEGFYPQIGPGCDFVMRTNEPIKDPISVGPIPAAGELKIEAITPLGNLRIIDNSGRVVRLINVNRTVAVIDISTLENGTYMIVQENMGSTRFVVCH